MDLSFVRRLLALMILGAGMALAQSATTVSVALGVGQTRSVPVGYARGLICDDLSVVSAQLKGGEKENLLLLTGLKPGSTLCRAGTEKVGTRYLVSITVSPRARAW